MLQDIVNEDTFEELYDLEEVEEVFEDEEEDE